MIIPTEIKYFKIFRSHSLDFINRTMDPNGLKIGIWASRSGHLGVSIWASGRLDPGIWASRSGHLGISIWASGRLDLGIWASRSGHLGISILASGPLDRDSISVISDFYTIWVHCECGQVSHPTLPPITRKLNAPHQRLPPSSRFRFR